MGIINVSKKEDREMHSFQTRIKQFKKQIKTPSLIINKERAAFSSSFYLKAGMALEACLAMPLFLFFICTLLLSLEMVRMQSNEWEKLHEEGSNLCFLAIEGNSEKENTGEYKEENERNEKKRKNTDKSRSKSIDDEGNLKITTVYSFKPLIYWLPIGDIVMQDSFFGHSWIGYTGGGFSKEEREKEEYVYITETGNKYHRLQNCTYLQVDIRGTKGWEIDDLRNQSREKYYACESCRPVKEGLVYITDWGNRYHGESDCKALKRTVFIIPLSKAKERGACSKCG